MEKYIFTFGSAHLDEFFVNPNSVALVIEAENENIARDKVFNFKGIESKFFTSYPYNKYINKFINAYGMEEYSLDDLEKLRINQKINYPDYSGF